MHGCCLHLEQRGEVALEVEPVEWWFLPSVEGPSLVDFVVQKVRSLYKVVTRFLLDLNRGLN